MLQQNYQCVHYRGPGLLINYLFDEMGDAWLGFVIPLSFQVYCITFEILCYHLKILFSVQTLNPNLTLSLTSFLAVKTMMLVLIVLVLDWQRSVPILYLKCGYYCCPLSLTGSWPVAEEAPYKL